MPGNLSKAVFAKEMGSIRPAAGWTYNALYGMHGSLLELANGEPVILFDPVVYHFSEEWLERALFSGQPDSTNKDDY